MEVDGGRESWRSHDDHSMKPEPKVRAQDIIRQGGTLSLREVGGF